ncbi:MAG TPA: DnaJ C-terminal domain-containing protein, partial [Mycobacteriales bacterium]|nr:DnaJ C-terminal domain-containing protein [Mycobacteriales bacterium]
FHPDANRGDPKAEERFKEISEAYDVLSDDKRRKEYDEARTLFAGGGFRVPGGARGDAGGGFGGFDLGDLFGGGGGTGGLGDILGGIFGGMRGGSRQAAPRRGADIESEITLSFADAAAGVTVPVRLSGTGPCGACAGTGAKAGTTPRVCPTCEGTGQNARNAGGFAFAEPCRDCRGRGLVVDDPCPVCGGSGRARSERTINARIPTGVRDGQHIRLRGKGAPGERGGPAGDLIVTVHVAPHAVFGRTGDNLTVTVPVTFPEAALGAEIKAPTLGGPPVTLRLPAGTANGRTFRVRGRGLSRRDGTRGDLLVTVEVAVPQRLPEGAREALEKFATELPGTDVRADVLARAGGQ